MIDLKRVTEFCDLVFSGLMSVDLLPDSLERPYKEFEKYPKLLIDLINLKGAEAGYMEWLSEIGYAAGGLAETSHFWDLKNWVQKNPDFFTKQNLLHLKNSIAGRAHTFVFYRQDYVITVAEAERRWRKQNLRGNAQGRLAMWQSKPGSPWMTTTRDMEKVFGPEPVNDAPE